jgi:hypothetical protein
MPGREELGKKKKKKKLKSELSARLFKLSAQKLECPVFHVPFLPKHNATCHTQSLVLLQLLYYNTTILYLTKKFKKHIQSKAVKNSTVGIARTVTMTTSMTTTMTLCVVVAAAVATMLLMTPGVQAGDPVQAPVLIKGNGEGDPLAHRSLGNELPYAARILQEHSDSQVVILPRHMTVSISTNYYWSTSTSLGCHVTTAAAVDCKF